MIINSDVFLILDEIVMISQTSTEMKIILHGYSIWQLKTNYKHMKKEKIRHVF